MKIVMAALIITFLAGAANVQRATKMLNSKKPNSKRKSYR